MRFKIDDNYLLRSRNFFKNIISMLPRAMDQGLAGKSDAHIAKVCLEQRQILVTLDLDFADIRVYPPAEYPGLMVIRVHRQDKYHVINVFSRAILLIKKEPLEKHLWIIEEGRTRIRGGE